MLGQSRSPGHVTGRYQVSRNLVEDRRLQLCDFSVCLGKGQGPRKGAGTGKARGPVARGGMAPDWSEITYSHGTRVDSKDLQSPGSSLVIKNSACNLFYKEGFRTSFLHDIKYAFHLLVPKQSLGLLCNKVQYLVIFNKSSVCPLVCRYVSGQTYHRFTIHIHNIYYL